MAGNQDLLDAIKAADEETNEIAEGIEALLARETLSEEGVAAAQALAAKLRGVAAIVPEVDADEPPVEPPADPA